MSLLYKKVLLPVVMKLTESDPEKAHRWMVLACRFPNLFMVVTSGRYLLLLAACLAGLFGPIIYLWEEQP